MRDQNTRAVPATDGVPWDAMGRADFDRSKLAKGYRPAPADQAGLFYMPAPERETRPGEPAAQLDGQEDLFGGSDPS